MTTDKPAPGPYGISVWESLQHDAESAKTPVIFVSGVVEEDVLRKRIASLPNNRFMSKPVDLPKLHGVITDLLEKRSH